MPEFTNSYVSLVCCGYLSLRIVACRQQVLELET